MCAEWQESSGDILYSCWGKIKKDAKDPEKFVVFEEGKPMQGIVKNNNLKRDEDGNIIDGNITLKTKEFEHPILICVNASMKRQLDELQIDVGDEIQVEYTGKYDTKNGKKGNGVKLRKRVK